MTLPGLVRANNLNDVVDRERAWDNLGSSLATGDISIPAPSLDLNFAANKSLVDAISGNNLITFTRIMTGASVATYVGADGLIKTAGNNVPRFDHNPTTGESLGLLVEEARTNLLLQSSDLTTASWGLTNVTRTANSTTAPDGTNTAVKIASTTGTWQTFLSQVSVAGITAIPTTFSCYAKAAEANWFCLAGIQFGEAIAFFNLATGALGTRSAGSAHSITPVGNGWYRCSVTCASASSTQWGFFPASTDNTLTPAPIGNGVHVWGPQLEAGAFPTSYIPTTGATVTRAADVASMTGANFSSWYNQDQGTFFANYKRGPRSLMGIVTGLPSEFGPALIADERTSRGFTTRNGGAELFDNPSVAIGANVKQIGAYNAASPQTSLCVNGRTIVSAAAYSSTPTGITIGGTQNSNYLALNSSIARLTYWPSRLNDKSLPYITQPSIAAINLYAFNYAINGKDVLALNAVRNASTRNFIFIKGLLSAAQPRLTTAAASTSSALTLATNALPKLSPTSSGNYFFASGITLSGVTTRINGTNALSIATSPFSGSTATAPLLFRELRPQANWRFTEPMPSGTIASPEFAIPFETNDFVLFMKAGPN
jgi:hypothetical protein